MQRDLQSDLNINAANVNADLIAQPGLFAYYTELLANAERQVKSEKLQMDVFEAMLDRQVRDKYISTGQKPTEKLIEMAKLQNDQFINWRNRIADAEMNVQKLKGIVESVRQKKDMLITYATNLRTEMQSFIHINKPQIATELKDSA